MRIGIGGLAVLLALALGATGAEAASVTFFGEDAGQGETTRLSSFPNALEAETDFLGYLDSSVTTATFESFSTGQTNLGLNFTGSAGSTIQAAINGTFLNKVASTTSGNTDGYGRYAISGSKYYDALTTVSISLNADASAIGFWGVDVGDFNKQLRVVLTESDGTTASYTIPNSTNATGGGAIFWGIVTEDAFRSISIQTIDATGSASFDRFALDDLIIGDAEQLVGGVVTNVPEPGSLLLLGGGALALGLLRRRRHVRSQDKNSRLRGAV